MGHAQIFPPSRDVFEPLKADPRELQYAIRAVIPVGEHRLGEAAMGDYFGVNRWTTASGIQTQFSVGGGVFSRFDLAARSNNLEVVDFYANLPVDARIGKWSGRFMLFHTSSHLGDDYVRSTGAAVTKRAWDVARLLNSYDVASNVRMYGGASYSFRTLPAAGRKALQAGLELQSDWYGDDHWKFFLASDFQSWERVGWQPQLTTQVGLTYRVSTSNPRTATLFSEFGTGHMPYGQFYRQSETRWTLGVRLTLS